MEFKTLDKFILLTVCLNTFIQSSFAVEIQDNSNYGDLFWPDVNLTNVIDIFAPVSNNIDNKQCRRQSLLYLKELRKFTLWATEMFDSTTKFPNGILIGSTYNLGNFDECVQVNVEINQDTHEVLKGQYCLAKIKFEPLTPIKAASEKIAYFNASAWEKIQGVSNDPSKRVRNEVHWSFCIPASCKPRDLQIQIDEVLEMYRGIFGFKAEVSVDERMCQFDNGLNFNYADIAFMSIIAIFGCFLSISTGYNLLLTMKGFNGLKIKNKLHDVLMAFSVTSNLKKLLTYKEEKDGLDCIHGLKFVSICLIIMGHRIMFVLGSPIVNPNFIENFYGKIEAMILLNGPIVVDTFFNISGFLVSYLLLVEFRKARKFNFLMLYVHRLVRLTPAYLVVLAFYCTIFVNIGSGPMWAEKVGVEAERCQASWWANLLYVNNYINADKLCMIQSWYITCDMHFFIISPFLVYLMWKKPTIGKIVLFTCIVASIVIAFCITYFGKLDALLLLYMKMLQDPVSNATFRNIYVPTHTRASPYFVGIATGYLRYKLKYSDIKIPKMIVWFGWIAAIFCIEATIFSAWWFYLPGQEYSALTSALYGAFHRFTWSMGISWMILAMSTGNGAFIEPIFSWKPVITLSRLTYCAFLAHGGVQLYSVATARTPYYTSIFNLIWYSLGDITLSYFIALGLTLAFESPILGLEKIILGKGEKNQKSIENYATEDNNNRNQQIPQKCSVEISPLPKHKS